MTPFLCASIFHAVLIDRLNTKKESLDKDFARSILDHIPLVTSRDTA